jgi:hypothetical protein
MTHTDIVASCETMGYKPGVAKRAIKYLQEEQHLIEHDILTGYRLSASIPPPAQ